MVSRLRDWWVTWRVWRLADAEQRAILTGPIDMNDYVEAPRPKADITWVAPGELENLLTDEQRRLLKNMGKWGDDG